MEAEKEGWWKRVAKERLGILGGTFNPVHSGHISMAKAAMKAAKLDRVLMLPDGVPPHKTGIASAEDRWRMLCAAVAQEPGLEPCRLELDRGGVTYTVDTLTGLHSSLPKAELYYIIGADTLMELHNWRFFERVLALCTFLVVPRVCDHTPGEIDAERRRLTGLGGKFISVDMPPVGVSSREVREAIRQDLPTPLLPVPVREYAQLMGLYGCEPRIIESEVWMGPLFNDLSRKRFAHTLAVASTARSLALIHHVDAHKAEVAALLHDCAKCLPLAEMQRVARRGGRYVEPELLESDNLLHSVAGAALAKDKYGVSDPAVLDAIASHTTGHADMSPLAMVVYLADKIEPTRQSYPTLDKVRMLASLSLERAMLASVEGTAAHVESKGKGRLHPRTL